MLSEDFTSFTAAELFLTRQLECGAQDFGVDFGVAFLVSLFEKHAIFSATLPKKKYVVAAERQLPTDKNLAKIVPKLLENNHAKQGQLSLLTWQHVAEILRDYQNSSNYFSKQKVKVARDFEHDFGLPPHSTRFEIYTKAVGTL